MSAPARLVVILGPTASGKSALAIRLAQQLGGEVVVCDSTQVYRHFHIGTAKVPRSEQAGIRHWMMDLVEPSEVFTAGDYRRRTEEVLGDIRARNRLPIITAGTGLYLRALLEGLCDAPSRSEELRARLRSHADARGPEFLHRTLHRLDPGATACIAPRDAQKIIRALEIRLLSQKPVAEVHGAGRAPLEGFAPVKIGLRPARAALYARIERRVETMFAAGWLAEVRALLAAGISPAEKPFTFIGYREILEFLSSSLSDSIAEDSSPPPPELSALMARIQKSTRHFAKRQLTWFSREPNVHWLAAFGDDRAAVSRALALLSS